MLSLDPKIWQDELAFAHRHARKHHLPVRKMIERYATKWYRDDITGEPNPENYIFLWVHWMLSNLGYSSPVACVEPNWETVHGDTAKYMERAMLRWSKTVALTDNLRLWVRDALFAYGVVKVGMERVGDAGGTVGGRREQLRPYLQHIPMDEWGCDARCQRVGDARFQYHRYEMDVDEARLIQGADPEAAKTLVNTYNSTKREQGAQLTQGETPTRPRCTLYDVWIPERKMIGTLIGANDTEATGAWLVPPRPWWGPSNGPFITLGFDSVPGDPYPMSPLQAVIQNIEKLNAHEVALAIEAATLKTVIGVDAAFSEQKDILDKSISGQICLLPNMAQSPPQVLKLGDMHPSRLEFGNRTQEKIERQLAMGPAQQGISNGQTATANAIAQQSSDSRIQAMRGQINEAAQKAFVAVGWYMFYDPNYQERITLEQEAMGPIGATGSLPVGGGPLPVTGGNGGSFLGTGSNLVETGSNDVGASPTQSMTQPPTGGAASFQQSAQPQTTEVAATFIGGVEGGWDPYSGEFFPPMEDVSWEDDFQVVIDPESTSYTSDQAKQQDALTLLQVQQTAYTALMTMPGANVEYAVNLVGESMNRRNLFSKLFDMPVVEQSRALAQQAAMMNPEAPPEGASPATVHAMGGAGGGITPSMMGGMASPQAGQGFQGSGKPGQSARSAQPA